MSQRKYTLQFKEEAVKLITEQGYGYMEASKSLGIPHSNLSRWVKESSGLSSVQKGGIKKEPTAEQKELEALRRENKRLKMEREILKKAAAFFANEPN